MNLSLCDKKWHIKLTDKKSTPFEELQKASEWLNEQESCTSVIDRLTLTIEDVKSPNGSSIFRQFWSFVNRHQITHLIIQVNFEKIGYYLEHQVFQSITSQPALLSIRVDDILLRYQSECEAFCKWIVSTLSGLQIYRTFYDGQSDIDLIDFWKALVKQDLSNIVNFSCATAFLDEQDDMIPVRQYLMPILDKMTNLTTLSLSPSLITRISSLEWKPTWMWHLHHLSISSPPFDSLFSFLFPPSYSLTKLCLQDTMVTDMCFTQILEVAKESPNLAMLGLPRCGDKKYQPLLVQTFRALNNLSELDLNYAFELDDNTIVSVIDGMMTRTREMKITTKPFIWQSFVGWPQTKYPLFIATTREGHHTMSSVCERQQTLRFHWLACVYLLLLECTSDKLRTSGFMLLPTIAKLCGFDILQSRSWLEQLSQTKFVQNCLIGNSVVIGLKRKTYTFHMRSD